MVITHWKMDQVCIKLVVPAIADSKFVGADLSDINGFGTLFNGSDMESANFFNALLSSASFGQSSEGRCGYHACQV